MRRRTIALGAATAALALSSLSGAAVAATDPQISFVHGLPGVKRVDICVDNAEIKSRMRYARAFKVDIPAGNHKLVVKKAAPGKCKGQTLAKINGPFADGTNVTLVVMKAGGSTGFLPFDNTLGLLPKGDFVPLSIQNAAKAGVVEAYVATFDQPTGPLPPTFTLARGEQGFLVVAPGFYSAWGSKSGAVKPLIGPSVRLATVGKRRHFVLVGSKPKNYRVVSFQTKTPEA